MTGGRLIVVVYALLSGLPVVAALVTEPDGTWVVVAVLTVGLWAGSRVVWAILLVLDMGGALIGFGTGDVLVGLTATLRLAVLVSPPMREHVGVGSRTTE